MDKTKELISVILPVYKVEEYLDRCMRSITNQTYRNLEIILVDDGSPDECPQLCDEWAMRDARVKVIHKANAGVSKARNTGIEAASGKYLMFVDADDYLSETAVEVLYDRLNKDQSDIAVGQAVHTYEDGRELIVEKERISDAVYSRDEVLRMFGTQKYLPCYSWSKLFKAELFLEVRYPALICGEDQYLWLDLIIRAGKITTVSDNVYYYYQREDSCVHKRNERKYLDSMTAELHCARFFLERNMLKQARYFFSMSIFHALEVENRRKVIELYEQNFSPRERLLLLRKDAKTIYRWLSVYCPFLYNAVRRLKK